jgi:biotin carboxylase
MKTLLILGGGYADIPLIQAGKKLGYRVLSSGNKPEELGHTFSDGYVDADFSNQEEVLKIAKKLSIDGICPSCNDFSAISAAFVAEQLGFPGHDSLEVSEVIHHKDRFREFSLKNQFPVPKAIGCKSIADGLQKITEVGIPAIVKPVDLTGGKGISVVEDISNARVALEQAFTISKVKRVVIEQFVLGTRHGFSVFLVDRKVVFFFADDEYYFINPYLVAGAVSPDSVKQNTKSELVKAVEKYASLLQLKNGIFHVQYICSKNGPVIIECCRRAPGDLYLNLVRYATGIDYAEYIVRATLGLDCSRIQTVEPFRAVIRHCVMPSVSGRVQDVVIGSSLQDNIIDSLFWWKKGEYIDKPQTHKCGIVFLGFNTPQEMRQELHNIQKNIYVLVE